MEALSRNVDENKTDLTMHFQIGSCFFHASKLSEFFLSTVFNSKLQTIRR